MADKAAITMAQLTHLVTKLGLVKREQLDECLAEMVTTTDDPAPLLGIMERKAVLTPLQIDKLLKGDLDGYFLGGYRLLYKIASGSFGRVYRGDDPNSGRVVAIKVLRQRWSERPETIELFEREGRVGLSLRHPNIVEVLNVGKDPVTKQYFIVMEFVEGGNLRDVLAIRKKFQPVEALKLLGDIVAALAYAVSRGVTHRDIKLTNILISTQGVAKLVDYGLARIYSSKYFTDSDDIHVQRTVDYAGLEKATGVQFGDIRSDIFFAGCVFYEMLTSRPPLLPTRDRMARMRRDRFESIQPITIEDIDAPPPIAASLVRLTKTMMALDPKKRVQTPAQLLDAIKQCRAEVTGEAKPDSTKLTMTTVFVVEPNEHLQNVMRERLRKHGYRALIAADPNRAVERFQQQPYAALIVDAETSDLDGIHAFRSVLREARDRNLVCSGILILPQSADVLPSYIPSGTNAVILKRPVTMKQLTGKLQELIATAIPEPVVTAINQPGKPDTNA
jgi:serine/threonine protein kinase